MKNNGTMVVVLVLLVIAIVLGIVIYSNGLNQNTAGQNNNTNTPPSPPKVTVQSLVDANPGPNATQDQLKTYSAKVFQASSESDTLDVSGCNPKPDVLHVKIGGSYSIKNTDNSPHKLVNGTVINLVVPANSDKNSTLDLKPGIYAYTCDTKMAGILIVSP